MKQIIFLLLLISGCFLNAQTELDTIFYSKKWDKISSRDTASYYRLAEISDNLYKFQDYFINGALKSEGQYIGNSDSSKRTGVFKFYYENGQLDTYKEYDSNKLHGVYKDYDSIGTLIYEAFYKQDSLDGKVKIYFPSKKIKREETFINGISQTSKCFNEAGEEVNCLPFYRMAEFVGGEDAMAQFLVKNIKVPKKAIRKSITGNVHVQFFVEIDGSLSSFEIIKSLDKLLDDEAIRVVKLMPKWIPRIWRGDIVRQSFELPIRFQYE